MPGRNEVETSKRLSYVLRHDPGSIGVVLDPHGWVEVSDLLAGLGAHGAAVTYSELVEVVANSDKQRFAFSDDHKSIRASQGHSVEVDLELEPRTPPFRLFHGTVERFLPNIMAQGLKAGQRHHVHLSEDQAVARAVGARRGTPIVLEIDAAAMQLDGAQFFRSENGVWLTNSVPPDRINRIA